MTNEEIIKEILDLAPGMLINGTEMQYDLGVLEYRARIEKELPKLLTQYHQDLIQEDIKRIAYGLVKEFRDDLITIAIGNEYLRGCVTSNQINDAFTDFWASTHDTLITYKKQQLTK